MSTELKPFVHGADANKISWMQDSARMLVQAMEMLPDDDGVEPVSEDYRKAIVAVYDFALLKHRSAVDLCVDFYEACKGEILRADTVIKAVAREKARYMKVMEAWRIAGYEAVMANQRQPFKGFRGAISIQKNGGFAPIEYAFNEDAPVTKDMTEAYLVEGRFLKVYVDKAAVRAALDAGEELPFAVMKDRGEGVRFKK